MVDFLLKISLILCDSNCATLITCTLVSTLRPLSANGDSPHPAFKSLVSSLQVFTFLQATALPPSPSFTSSSFICRQVSSLVLPSLYLVIQTKAMNPMKSFSSCTSIPCAYKSSHDLLEGSSPSFSQSSAIG